MWRPTRVRKKTLSPKPCITISKIGQKFAHPTPYPSLLFVNVIKEWPLRATVGGRGRGSYNRAGDRGLDKSTSQKLQLDHVNIMGSRWGKYLETSFPSLHVKQN